MVQIHKTFTDEQAKELMQRYVNQQVDRKHLQGLLGIKERRFFDLLKKYKEDPLTALNPFPSLEEYFG